MILVRVLAAETSPDHPTQAETEQSQQEPATACLSRAEFSLVSVSHSLGELKSLVFVLLRRGLSAWFWMYGEQKQLNSRKELESF